MKKIGFVTPWYGENIPGGAESELRSIVKHLNKSNIDLEILTTKVKDFSSDWNQNYYKEDVEFICGIKVLRFNVIKRNTQQFDQVNFKLINNIQISKEEENIFFKEMIRSLELEDYIEINKDSYHCFVFIPYMFGTTYWGLQRCIEKAVLIPCLHNEKYAYMDLLKNLFPKVRGVIFNAYPEKDLWERIYGKFYNQKLEVHGIIVNQDFNFNQERFCRKYNINNPFILYAGRKDKGKNVDLLLDYFIRYKSEINNNIELILIGGGEIEIPKFAQDYVKDLGFIDVQDKYDAYSASLFLCQPSVMESFSLVIMESWISKRPVLVHDNCEVTKHFTIKSNAGLYFNDYFQFFECVEFFKNNLELANTMGVNGMNFVKDNFYYKVVVKKYISFFEHLYDKE